MTSVDLTPAQVHELDQLHGELVDAQARAFAAQRVYQEASRRMYGRVQLLLEKAGVEEAQRTGEWRMIIDGEAVRLVLEESETEPPRE